MKKGLILVTLAFVIINVNGQGNNAFVTALNLLAECENIPSYMAGNGYSLMEPYICAGDDCLECYHDGEKFIHCEEADPLTFQYQNNLGGFITIRCDNEGSIVFMYLRGLLYNQTMPADHFRDMQQAVSNQHDLLGALEYTYRYITVGERGDVILRIYPANMNRVILRWDAKVTISPYVHEDGSTVYEVWIDKIKYDRQRMKVLLRNVSYD